MKYETVHDVTIPKIGFGTWKIGGGSRPDPKLDPVSLAALHSALEVGYTHFDTAETYANGHAEELLGRAIREMGVRREALFITSKVQPAHLKYEQVLKSCEASLNRLGTDYLDLYLIHWPRAGGKYEETFRALNKLVRDGKVKHLGVSNFNLKLLKQSQSLSETPIVTNQVPYSLSDRSYVKNGVLEYCQQNDILLTAYEPVNTGNLRSNKTLEAIAKAHNATIFQIALAWLVQQPRVITIPMSFNPQHIKENFDAADIVLTNEELTQLTNA
ncbi:MAG: aldo/keto reductase [Anaerolineales bacterium]|nr:aldo/keto reductase [Anaerolineales bacterium]NUQ83784.1 aldo/keto reductase [Anaerolineales bacterium]